MKVFFDTSVLIAAALVQHVHHQASFAAYSAADKKHCACAAHSLAEVYSTVTRLPGQHRVSCEQALVLLEDITQRLTTVALDGKEYCSAIAAAAGEGILGGTVYDALLAHCALKTRADVIYTWDVRDFQRLGPEIAKRARTP